jgi:hypothetical protein
MILLMMAETIVAAHAEVRNGSRLCKNGVF